MKTIAAILTVIWVIGMVVVAKADYQPYQPVIPIPQSSQSDQWKQNQQLNQDMMWQYKQWHKPIEPQLAPSYYEYDSKTGITKWCLYLGNNMWSCR